MITCVIPVCKHNRIFPLFIQRRYRVKTKWASTQPKKTSCDLALEHFDLYYKPVFGSRWPSMRLALLSSKKYSALINNFASHREMITLDLAELGAYDIIEDARKLELPLSDQSNGVQEAKEQKRVEIKQDLSSEHLSTAHDQDFMPVKRIISEKEKMKLDEAEQSLYRSNEESELAMVDPKSPLHIPHHLAAFAQHAGDVSGFPPARRDSSDKLNYYLMDAASILPVIALNLEPGCKVIDLCAAPGGKSLSILQTLLPDELTCVDRSYSRVQRLKDVMRLYVPKSYVENGKVRCFHDNAIEFCRKSIADKNLYDRVLVDVPCYADRHNLEEEDNNLFRPSRLGERLQLQALQQNLLFAGIQSCRPGGIVVYSTCTLAPTQNDGVVRATLERIWQETEIDVAVENVGEIVARFSRAFAFHPSGLVGSRYGCLVVPNVTKNFGPMYFCRLRRTN